MKRLLIEVDLVVPEAEVMRDGGFSCAMQGILNRLKSAANKKAAEVGGSVTSTVNPELVIKQGIDPSIGENCFMFGSRWAVDVPDRAFPTSER